MVEIPPQLQREPEIRRHAKQLLEAQRGVRCDGSLALDQLIGARPCHANALGEFGLCHPKWLEELLENHLARMGRWAVRGDANHGCAPNNDSTNDARPQW